MLQRKKTSSPVRAFTWKHVTYKDTVHLKIKNSSKAKLYLREGRHLNGDVCVHLQNSATHTKTIKMALKVQFVRK